MQTHVNTTMPKDLVLLRYTDPRGVRLAALCRPAEGVGTLKEIIGEADEADRQWFDDPHDSAVVIDTRGTVIVTSAEDLTLLSRWFSVAANWLKKHGG